MAARFEYGQAEEIAAAFRKNGVRYLFLGKSGAILLGYPDTTQDADLFVEKSPANGQAIVADKGNDPLWTSPSARAARAAKIGPNHLVNQA